MSCIALETILKSCDNNSGGLHRVWVNQQVNIDEDSAFTFLAAPNEYTIATIPLIVPAVLFTELEFKRNVSSYTEESNIDLINGSSFVTQTINLMFHRRNQTYSQAIKVLGSGQQYLAAIVEDANGLYWYFPFLQVSATGEGSGTARADGSKYSVTLVAENEFLAFQVDAAEIPNVI